MDKFFIHWEQVPRFNGTKMYMTYRCPHCQGSGMSPYHDENGYIIRCECCKGRGHWT